MADRFLTNHFINTFVATKPDQEGFVANVVDRFDLRRGIVVMRSFEAGWGITLDVVDVDDRADTEQKKIIVSANKDEVHLKTTKMYPSSDNQTTFTVDEEIDTILIMTINGLETKNYTFNKPTLEYDTVAEGYTLSSEDELIIFYYK